MKESRVEALAREAIQSIGSVVAPSMLASEVLAYRLVPGSGSRYSVTVWAGDHCEKLECSQAQLKQLLREDISEEAVI